MVSFSDRGISADDINLEEKAYKTILNTAEYQKINANWPFIAFEG